MNTTIRPLASSDYPEFFAYLNAQLALNGKHGYALFQPVSREVADFPSEKESSFVSGLSKTIGQPGWRRAWVICDEGGNIMGHVDMRAHADSSVTHRALLGMGVGAEYRNHGYARQLLEFGCQWVRENSDIEWVDIEVLSANQPALTLYRSAGFEQLCEIPDMFRIDGNSEAVVRLAARFV